MGVYSSLITDRTRKLAKSARSKVATVGKRKSSGVKSKSSSTAHLRPLPKEQPARFFAHFRWERIKAYWFSKDGLRRIGKIFAACVLLGIIGVGALFVYYKSQLKEIQLIDLSHFWTSKLGQALAATSLWPMIQTPGNRLWKSLT